MTDQPDEDGYLYAVDLRGRPMIARPGDDAFQTLDQIKDVIARVSARQAQLREEAERWRPLDDQ